MKISFCSTSIDFEGDMEFDPRDKDMNSFAYDGLTLPIEEFMNKWGITNLVRLGKYHCRAGYQDRLHPEKSWTGQNPETLEKLRKYIESLEKELENGSQSEEDKG